MDTDKIMCLVRVEVIISRYYKQLCQKEIMKQYGSDFTSLIGLLKTAIEEQNRILNTLNIIELVNADGNEFQERLKYCEKEVDTSNIMPRLSILSTSKLVSKSAEDGLFIANKELMSAKYIAMGESVNIQLSFIDEYLSQTSTFLNRLSLELFPNTTAV